MSWHEKHFSCACFVQMSATIAWSVIHLTHSPFFRYNLFANGKCMPQESQQNTNVSANSHSAHLKPQKRALSFISLFCSIICASLRAWIINQAVLYWYASERAHKYSAEAGQQRDKPRTTETERAVSMLSLLFWLCMFQKYAGWDQRCCWEIESSLVCVSYKIFHASWINYSLLLCWCMSLAFVCLLTRQWGRALVDAAEWST